MSKIIVTGVLVLSIIAMAPCAYAGKMELTTFYPAPYGEYTSLKSTDNTYLATTSGNVGIGTTNPTNLLHMMRDSNAARMGVTIENLDERLNLSAFYQSGVAQYSVVQSSNDAGTGNNLILNPDGGNVGIGTTPNANMKLQVAGEMVSSALGAGGGNIRIIGGNYGAFFRSDGSNLYLLLTNSGDQYGTWNALRPWYANLATGYVTFGNGHGDLAENYWVSGTALRGSLMSIDKAKASTVILSDLSSQFFVGVVTTNPGSVMDADGGFHIGFKTQPQYSNEKAPVALVGIVPALVMSQNGPIAIGDPVGTSSLPGFGAKAVAVGPIVGNAFESFEPSNTSCPAAVSLDTIAWPKDDGKNPNKPCFQLSDGTYVGKIMISVRPSWYHPRTQTTSEFQKTIDSLKAENQSQERTIQDLVRRMAAIEAKKK
jgi:hypothetical protein